MTGEGSEDTMSRASAKKKKKLKKTPIAPESEDSILSGMTKPSSAITEGAATDTHADGEEHEDEEDDEDDRSIKMKKKPTKALAPLDRNKFGKFITSYGVGGAFGEVALVHRDLNRNASVITDEDSDLMVIDQDLFDRSLRAEQEAKYEEIRKFIDEHPFFNQMNTKFKKLLEMSLRKETYIFDTNIIRQGEPVVGLHFIISGSARVSIQPKKHQHQYPHLWPFEAGIDQLSIEFEHLREARRAAILRKYEDPSVWETKPEELVIRREQGYAAIEKKMKENHINLCTVQTREVLGDVEMLLNLSTYMQTVRCTANTECFVLDTKNFERLVSKRNNPQTMDIMREYVKSKLHTRMNMRNADLIPFLGYLHQKLTEQLLPPAKKELIEPFRMSKAVPDVEEEMQHLLQYFKEGKEVVLIKPSVPGVVYYRELMREKAKARETQRKSNKGGDGIKLGSVHKTQPRRKPRSMLQIRESLRQMMEAEVIELETKKQTKKRRLKSYPDGQTSHRTHVEQTPRTLIGDQNREQNEESRNNLMDAMRTARERREKESQPNETSSENTPDILSMKDNPDLPKSTPPVFVTEVSKNPLDPALPAIREESSQDEILLHPNSKRPKSDATPDNTKQNKTSKLVSKEAKLVVTKKGKQITVPDSQQAEKTVELPPINSAKSPNPAHSDKEAQGCADEGVKLPALLTKEALDRQNVGGPGGTETTAKTDVSESTASSHWNTAMAFVNKRIQDRLKKSLMEEETDYKDYETSEPSLSFLENRIQAFHVKYGMGSKTKNLPHLKRYKLDLDEELRPKPGGKVWVKKQLCKFKDSEYMVKDHKHVRYRMVETIPEFEKVQKSKVVMQQILKTSELARNEL